MEGNEDREAKKLEALDRKAHLLIWATLLIVFLSYLLFASEKLRCFLGFGDRGSTGEFISGIASPFIGFASAVLVYLSFRQQLKANQIQLRLISEQKQSKKDEESLNRYKNVIGNLRKEVRDLRFKNPFDDGKMLKGMQALEVFSALAKRKGISPIINENENLLDSLHGIVLLLLRLLWEARKESDDIKNEAIDEAHIFYSLKIGKALNTIKDVKGHKTVEMIKENRKRIEDIFIELGLFKGVSEVSQEADPGDY